MHLFNVYVATNKDLDEEEKRSGVYEKVYERLNVHFDVYAGESIVSQDVIWSRIKALSDKNLITSKKKDEGHSTPLKLGKPVIEKPDGTTYIVRDIAGVIGDQQALHVAQFLKILALMEVTFSDRLEHISFGKAHGTTHGKWHVKFLEDILDASKEVMLAQITKTRDQGKRNNPPCKAIHPYHFDLQRITGFEGDTGAYLQYAHVRLASIQRKVAPAVILPDDDPSSIDTSNRSLVLYLSSRLILVSSVQRFKTTNHPRLSHAVQESVGWLVQLWKFYRNRDGT